jgi:hypothetical protein
MGAVSSEEKEWLTTWKSVETTDSKTLYKFPEAVEIDLVIEKNKREIKLSTIAAIHMPNNEPFKNTTTPQTGQQGQQQAPQGTGGGGVR